MKALFRRRENIRRRIWVLTCDGRDRGEFPAPLPALEHAAGHPGHHHSLVSHMVGTGPSSEVLDDD